MKNRTQIFSFLFILLLFLILPSGIIYAEAEILPGFDIMGITVTGSGSFVFNSETDANISSAASPFIIYPAGISVPMRIGELFYLDPGIRFYFPYTVIFSDDVSRPVPATREDADRIEILAIDIRPEAGVIFPLSEDFELGVTGAPSLLFRLPLIGYDNAGDDVALVRQYYLAKARFLSLYTGGFFNWNFSDSYILNIKAGTDLPFYNLWDGSGTAFYDQLKINLEIGFRFNL